MTLYSKSIRGYRQDNERLFARNPVLTLETWAKSLGGASAARRARERARYYTGTGRLRRLARGIYAVVPPGVDSENYLPDPYLVAASLRSDAILSHHTALDLLGVSHSVFNRFAYFTASPRRTSRLSGMSWNALRHPAPLVSAHKIDFGVVTLDRQGVLIRVTGAERTLVDGFAGLPWVGGLEEHVESAAAMRDLDLELLEKYLRILDQRILYAAVGWFLEKCPEVAGEGQSFLRRLEKHAPRQPLYVGKRRPGGRLESRWNLVVPPHLSTKAGFEGVAE